MSFNYRPEIDGLRAIAVLPVIFFHAGFSSFSGGYIGVDVFFVISGYLITSIILADLDSSTFSFGKFYERRAKRLFPAIFLMILISIGPAYFLLFPPDLRDFFQSIAFISFFSSNILFWFESGYFEAASELKPFLHTWSLAIEEQFYFFFPLLLVTLYKKNIKQKFIYLLFVSIFISSFIFSAYASVKMPSVNFFLIPSRVWELLFGVLIAIYMRSSKRMKFSPVIENILSSVGLTLIIVSVYLFDNQTPYPSVYTLLPTLGTGLIILPYSDNNFVHRLLKSKILVGIGLVSYGAYMYHQPLFVFYKHYKNLYYVNFLDEYKVLISLGLVSLTFFIAFFSWKYFETPLRYVKVERATTFKINLAISILLIITFGALQSDRFFQPFMKGEFSNYFNYDSARKTNECFLTSTNKNFNYQKCLLLSENKKNVLVFGDSYSDHLMPGLKETYPDINFLQASASGCVPTVNNKNGAYRCLELKKFIFNDFLPKNGSKISSVIISFKKWWEVGLVNVQNTLEFVKVFVPGAKIMSPNIHFNIKLPYILNKGIGKTGVISSNSHLIDDRQFKLNQRAKTLFSRTEYIDLLGQICDGDMCKTLVNDAVPLIYDHGHFTQEGSLYLMRRLKKQFDFYRN